jgi:phycobilisome core-membrane linker protein
MATSAKASARAGLSRTSTLGAAVAEPTPIRIYRLSADDTSQVLGAIYAQMMDVEADHRVPSEWRLVDLEPQLGQGLTVKPFIRALATSEAYAARYGQPFPVAKMVDILFRHLLGRAVATDLERVQYTQLLQTEGLAAAVDAMLNSGEYNRFFGEDVVPYRRDRV